MIDGQLIQVFTAEPTTLKQLKSKVELAKEQAILMQDGREYSDGLDPEPLRMWIETRIPEDKSGDTAYWLEVIGDDLRDIEEEIENYGPDAIVRELYHF